MSLEIFGMYLQEKKKLFGRNSNLAVCPVFIFAKSVTLTEF